MAVLVALLWFTPGCVQRRGQMIQLHDASLGLNLAFRDVSWSTHHGNFTLVGSDGSDPSQHRWLVLIGEQSDVHTSTIYRVELVIDPKQLPEARTGTAAHTLNFNGRAKLFGKAFPDGSRSFVLDGVELTNSADPRHIIRLAGGLTAHSVAPAEIAERLQDVGLTSGSSR